jgi:hypothetical protein
MLEMTGRLVNTFKANDSIDPSTGEKRIGKHKVQVMGFNPLESGENRMELQDLSCPDIEVFKPFLQKEIRFEVGIAAMGGNVYLYVPKGAIPYVPKGAIPKIQPEQQQ